MLYEVITPASRRSRPQVRNDPRAEPEDEAEARSREAQELGRHEQVPGPGLVRGEGEHGAHREPRAPRVAVAVDPEGQEGEGSEMHRARRHRADQAERKDSFILSYNFV